MTWLLELLRALIAFLRLRTEQAKGEKEKRKVAEYEAEAREKEQEAAANAVGLAHDPDAFADKLRDDL